MAGMSAGGAQVDPLHIFDHKTCNSLDLFSLENYLNQALKPTL